ncbi:MAG: hypothetical protein H0W34_05415 [Pyrinomonadaceae bacterium]|nr:hypothetical protein [Pyrinomonadaceae bacterium]
MSLPLVALMPSLAAFAQEQAPLQADARMRVHNNKRPVAASFSTQLAGGPATVTGRVSNLPGGDTALVALQFDYRVDADIALDEIISQIVVWVEDPSGNVFSSVTIDPNTIHLNPNRVPLHYSATLYTPELFAAATGTLSASGSSVITNRSCAPQSTVGSRPTCPNFTVTSAMPATHLSREPRDLLSRELSGLTVSVECTSCPFPWRLPR